jgi:site-specific DNA-methyltransferase (adenine-specific)
MIIQGDCVEVMKTLPDNSVDSVVTDPPYELGFMGKEWDKTGIANSVDMWREVLRILKPGGYLLSFGGTRTYHRMACAIEDAGFEIRDMVSWIYGSGFPKSLNIGKAVDKLQGNEREVVGTQMLGGNAAQSTKEKGGTYASNTNAVGVKPIEVKLTKGTSEWEGWGTALKPACEPCVLARKPLSEKTVALNVLKWGTGGINIDGSRVGTEETITNHSRGIESAISKGKYGDSSAQETHQTNGQTFGRFPANLIYDGSDEVLEVFPNTGISRGGNAGVLNNKVYGEYATEKNNDGTGFGDSGSAARFFYCAKASKSERNMWCEEMEEQQMDESRKEGNPGGDNPRNRGVHKRTNNHPTVKPLALMRHLITMVTPPKGTVLDPFAGSGSTLVAAKELGFDFIGIEKEPEYVKIAEARINAVQPKLL